MLVIITWRRAVVSPLRLLLLIHILMEQPATLLIALLIWAMHPTVLMSI